VRPLPETLAHQTLMGETLLATVNRVLFVGSKQLGLRVLQEMHSLSAESLVGVLTIDDRNDTRSVFPDFHEFSSNKALQLHVAKNRKDAERIIEQLKPDLCLVVGWYWLIGPEALTAVPSGFIGIHNSLLPKYRGGSPLIWPIINGDKEVGFSFFSFTPGMDDGPIWAQGRVSVEDDDFIWDILAKLENKTIEVLRENYMHILKGTITPVEQDHTRVTYCAQRFPYDGNIDWHKPAKDVYNFVRAQSDPYPGSFTYVDGQLLRIWKARRFEETYYGTPGQVARLSDEGVYVICGDHRAIILQEVSLGDQRGKAGNFIKSIKSRMSSNIGDSLANVKL